MRTAAIAGVVVFTLSWIAIGATAAPYDPLREYISGLAARTTALGWLMIIAFIALGVAEVATGALWWTADRRGRPTAAVLAAAGVFTVAAGLCRQECSTAADACWQHIETTGMSTTTLLHGLFSTAAFILPIAAVALAAWSTRAVDRRFAVASSLVAVVAATGTIAWAMRVTISLNGLLQRLVAVIVFGWVAGAAWCVAPPSKRVRPARDTSHTAC